MRVKFPNKQFSRFYRRFLYRFAGGMVLLLTTTGRKSGNPHTVGLQYELIEGLYWVGAADGTRADWYRNILALPTGEIQVSRILSPSIVRNYLHNYLHQFKPWNFRV